MMGSPLGPGGSGGWAAFIKPKALPKTYTATRPATRLKEIVIMSIVVSNGFEDEEGERISLSFKSSLRKPILIYDSQFESSAWQ